MLYVLSPWYWVTCTCRSIKAVVVNAWKRPSVWSLTKAAFLVWFLIPASVPVTAYKLAGLMGYENEARQLFGILWDTFGLLGLICFDALWKVLVVLATFFFAMLS